LHQLEPAETAYTEAISLLEPLPEPRARQSLADALNWRGELFRDSGRPVSDAENDYRRALALQQQLLEEGAGGPGLMKELARSHYNLGIVYLDTHRPDEAARRFDAALAQLPKAPLESDAEYHQER